MAYSQTFRRAGFHEAASLSDADPLHWLAICSASRSAARGRKPTGRAETGGKDAREAPCVARAHALPTRGSAWRTIGYVARPPAAPGDDGACACTPLGAHPLLCGMARSCHAAQYRAARLALRRLPGWGRFSCASAARSLLWGNDRRESGRQGRTAGLRQPHPRALRVSRTARTSRARSAATRHRYAAGPAAAPAFPGQSSALSRLLGSLAHERRRARLA